MCIRFLCLSTSADGAYGRFATTKLHLSAIITTFFLNKKKKMRVKSNFFLKKFGGTRKMPYLCIAIRKQRCNNASIAQLFRAPDC